MSKVKFIAIPPTAMFDKKLSAGDLRVLGAIASHDRMGKNGRGCFAAQGTLAEAAKCDLRSVERSIRHLVDRGYLTKEKSRNDARQRIYRIVYPEIPDKAVGHPEQDTRQGGQEYPTSFENSNQENQTLDQGKYNNKHIVLNEEANAAEAASFLRNDALPSSFIQVEERREGRSSGNVAGAYEYDDAFDAALHRIAPRRAEAEDHPYDAIGKRLLSIWDNNAFVAALDREVRNGARFQRDLADQVYERLNNIHESGDYSHGDPLLGRSYRLLETELERRVS